MKTLKIPQSFRHSAIEYFDRMVAAGHVEQFFVGAVDSFTERFSLAYELSDGEDDVPVAHLNPYPTHQQLKISVLGDIKPVEQLKGALAAISAGGNIFTEMPNAIDAIMEYCKITLSVAEFFDDEGHFKVESELEFK
jgi:hypothetical protein